MTEKVVIKDGLTYEEMKDLIDLSLQLGINSSEKEFLNIFFEGEKEYTLKVDKKSFVKDDMEADDRYIKGLEKIFSLGDFLQDKNEDGSIDHFNFKIQLDEKTDKYLLASACSFAYRLGLEIDKYESSILADENYGGNIVLFEKDENTGMEILGDTNKTIYRIYGVGENVLDFSIKICGSFPYEDNGKSLSLIINEIRKSLGMKDLDGQITYLLACKYMFNKEMKAYFSKDVFKKVEGLKLIFPEVEFFTYEEMGKTSPSIVVENNIIQNNDDLDEIDLYLKSLSYEDGKYICHLKTNVNEIFVKSYMILLENQILDMGENFKFIDVLKLQTGDKIYSANFKK